MKAVLLLSGGLDSYTAGAMAAADGYELYALTLRYGQVHAREIEAARKVARALGATRHLELDVPLSTIGGSALVGDGEIPKDRPLDATDIPSTYVPARNTVFLSLAMAWAEVVGAEAIVIGVNALDYSGYPDCRPEIPPRVRAARRAGHESRRRRAIALDPRAAPHAHKGRHHPPRPGPRRGLWPDAQLLRSRSRPAGRAAAATAAA